MDTVQMRLPEGANELDAALSQQLLVTAKQASRMCGRSLRTWRAWDSGGLIPQPVRIGRATLWRTDELRGWVKAGCPRRNEWEAQR
jgi:predicted DNA-binding transcriptional regulator AlpA